MSGRFYPKLALEGIRKNRKLYVPYLLTCVGMVFMYYILAALAVSPVVGAIKGAANTQTLLNLGRYMVAIFAALLLFYTNSFLTRRRQREFGLYNVLGMSKWNLARLLFWETLITAVVSLLGGIGLAIVLYKLAELALVRILNGAVIYDLTIVWETIPGCLGLFGGIFAALYLWTLVKVRMNDPAALLRSEQVGEKPPKANWLLALLGAGILGTAYWLAVTIADPNDVFVWFFAAVILVIIGTYLLFVAGSVVLCRLLQKNKVYYYKSEHFVSVSSMVYRMKRNGAGLASICILATMVLVMLSSAGSLVIGQEDILRKQYPREFMVGTSIPLTEAEQQEMVELLTEGMDVTREERYHALSTWCYLQGEELWFGGTHYDATMHIIQLVDLETYNRLNNKAETLKPDELLLVRGGDPLGLSQLQIQDLGRFRVKAEVETITSDLSRNSLDHGDLALVLPDLDICAPIIEAGRGKGMEVGKGEDWRFRLDQMFRYSFDTAQSSEEQQAHFAITYLRFLDFQSTHREIGSYSYGFTSRANEKQEFYGLFGGLLFLGILLSVVFLFATVLIIYYKQISEGYEDAARFAIMQKVGMTGTDIRRSIRSQMRTVFLLPVAAAGLHIAFAFPMIQKLLLMFHLDNTGLFLAATLVCFAAFGLLYGVVYRLTSHVYFKLVSSHK